jgi:hypothetical protein
VGLPPGAADNDRDFASARIRQVDVIDTLDIAILHRAGKITPGESIVTERHSVDFLVNGLSLFAATKADERGLCGCFWAAGTDARLKAYNQNVAEQLTFARPTWVQEINGTVECRVMLFVCPECGDLGCGAITADIARDGDLVVWSRFGHQYTKQLVMSDGPWSDDFASYESIGPFRFAWDAYKAVIQRAAAV